MMKDNIKPNTYPDLHQLGDHFYACYCPHGINPKDNCFKCCKYCGIPFRTFECSECGYNIE